MTIRKETKSSTRVGAWAGRTTLGLCVAVAGLMGAAEGTAAAEATARAAAPVGAPAPAAPVAPVARATQSPVASMTPVKMHSPAPAGTSPTWAVRTAAADPVAKIVLYARTQLGKPYIWGGTGPRGFDCSGLIQKSFAAAGVRIPRGSVAQSRAGKRISKHDLRPGDLVFSNHFFHIQLYVGNSRVIEAARPGTRVRISKMLPERMIAAYERIAVGDTADGGHAATKP